MKAFLAFPSGCDWLVTSALDLSVISMCFVTCNFFFVFSKHAITGIATKNAITLFFGWQEGLISVINFYKIGILTIFGF